MTERAECIDPSLGILRERRIPVLRMTSVEIKGRRIHSGRIRAGEDTCLYVDRDGTDFPALCLQIERDILRAQRAEGAADGELLAAAGGEAWFRLAQSGSICAGSICAGSICAERDRPSGTMPRDLFRRALCVRRGDRSAGSCVRRKREWGRRTTKFRG